MNCLVIDDENHAIDILTGHIERTPGLELVKKTTSPTEGILYLRSNEVDLIFLDIEMPEMTGIEVLNQLARMPFKKQPYFILTTAYSEYAVQSYEFNVVDYMMKPITYKRFLKGLNKIDNLFGMASSSEEVMPEEEDYILVKTGAKGKMIKIKFDDIQYIEGLKNYISISRDNTKIPVLFNLSDMEEKVPSSFLKRIHRSFIINLRLIEKIEGNEVVLQHDKRIPIGLSYREDFFQSIDDKILKK